MAEAFILKDLLKEKAEMFHVKLDETALERFDIYGKLLVEWNEKINLTAITDPEGVTIKHFLDSLTIFSYVDIPEGAKVIDVGTGAGFPGLAMLIARPDLDITLMDSTKKRLMVIENILENIGLSANVVHSRAEDAGQNKAFREQYDFSTARAVTNLRDLAEYCLPFVKVGGSFVPMKSAKAQEEIAEGKKAIHVLGGQIIKQDTFDLLDCGERTIINVKKISSTPAKYPRPSAKIAKNPIK
ncbi:MAG: 16S rRNA (guanine(527)-N(7))-methyltransferase RsmG [Clostridia bacterium]|nr:16S rRNA (guanine(527)-N(7))-methyltransferase RsmG [Clostridia bacterium]MBO7318980.1 16S rRNA (guanine(527)-N(7))-methyltransferase RsmG [Clostridia bacterium]